MLPPGCLRGRGDAGEPHRELAGPEPLPLDELVRRFLSATDDSRPVIADTRARYFGAELNDNSLMRIGSTRFERWLSQFKGNGGVGRGA